MPLVRNIGFELWEVRSKLNQRVARVIFTIQQDMIVLLHGFIKKSRRTPISDLKTARKRLSQFKDQAS
jgi:phage-related protein